MINAGLFDGDMAVIKNRITPKMAISWSPCSTMKPPSNAFSAKTPVYRLQPENPAMEPIIVNTWQILGKVVMGIHKF